VVESFFWKEILLQNEKALKPLKNPPRWSERRARILERDLSVCFFIVRRLIELHKISKKTLNHKIKVFAYKSNGKNVTLLNLQRIEELYGLNVEEKKELSIDFLSNQFIHSYIIFPYRNEDRNWGGLYICSDYERNRYIYKVSIEEIRSALGTVGRDYPTRMEIKFNKKINDYDIFIH
jgi:hypothetical protein